MKKKPSVAIIIVNWNKKELTEKCLNSLKMTFYKNYKVILVDNGSTDNSIIYLRKLFPNIHILSLDKNYGYTIGTNIGWRYAIKELKANYICAMDNDLITIQPEWLDLIIKELEKSEDYGIGSGKHLFEDGKLQQPFLGADPKDHYKTDTGKYDFIKEVRGYCGPGIVIKSSTIKKIGYYDENYFYGPNDIDYCFRARKSGIKIIYNGFSKSIHIGSTSGKTKNDYIYGKQAEGMMIFSFRWDKLIKRFEMLPRQFLRAFLTRKNTNEKRKLNNLYFYNNFPIRLYYWSKAVFNAIKNYKNIKNDEYPYKVII